MSILSKRRVGWIAGAFALLAIVWWANAPSPEPTPPAPAPPAPREATPPEAAPPDRTSGAPPPSEVPAPEPTALPAAPQAESTQFAVRPTYTVSGVVVSESGEVVPRARVVITGQDGAAVGSPETQRIVISGPDGVFSAGGLRSPRVAVHATHDDYWFCEPVHVNPPNSEVELTMLIGGVIEGTVFDATGREQANALLALEGGGRLRRVQTDENGQFRFQGLALAQYEIVVLARDVRTDEQSGDEPVPEKTRVQVEAGPGSFEVVEVRLRDPG